MSDSTVSDFPAKSFVYIYYMLKKITSSFLRYASYLTEAPPILFVYENYL